jgi:hypothetical protein
MDMGMKELGVGDSEKRESQKMDHRVHGDRNPEGTEKRGK